MFIKYKKDTSNILADLSIELFSKVDLKQAEKKLTVFFYFISRHVSQEKKIAIVCNLPSSIKPFIHRCSYSDDIAISFINHLEYDRTAQSIFKVLEKYVSAEKLAIIYSCLPEQIFISTPREKKQHLLTCETLYFNNLAYIEK